MKEKLKNIFFKLWYWYLSLIDKNADIIFMNYGYSKDSYKIELEETDEKNRYSIQLYHLVATGVDIEGKDILEVGCGRGGGLSYINRYLKPNFATGVDLNKRAINFCNNNYSSERIKFLQANAQKLNFPTDSFDIVINIESSHRYSRIDLFTNEVYRILKPGGFFLFADFGDNREIEKLNTQFVKSNLKIVRCENITDNVIEALYLAEPAREKLIREILPKFLQNIGRNFAAMKGTSTNISFLTKQFEYVFYILKK
ncbi:MAG: methyltransferase domain-containing protein [Prolixibacteraceae bacterium]|jgi:ubiquinone/menaquinone biosynthesis C-methylase UbiE|nr:methyltransferase domain-containing protein [Prolixibacteraceae bacterium]MBT6765049.1 methyltransferase domain-containing protein [Prolixibacteraceae bacterium]MBT7000166.1 methyltransferase domain-containing protein [Prolixibacteraceae bacterium]MBT7395656.1 methyltransferase domain-containing protein [Prolixibacteraceae bacterium]